MLSSAATAVSSRLFQVARTFARTTARVQVAIHEAVSSDQRADCTFLLTSPCACMTPRGDVYSCVLCLANHAVVTLPLRVPAAKCDTRFSCHADLPIFELSRTVVPVPAGALPLRLCDFAVAVSVAPFSQPQRTAV